MLSIVVCSKNKILPKEFVDNILNTVGVAYEIITIDNSENRYSIFSAYNQGVVKSKYPYICFVHEDVFFHSVHWGEKVIAHLQNPKTGIIGVAGGDLITRVPASWSGFLSQSKNITQSDRTGKVPTKTIRIPLNYNHSERSVIILDGVFMCMRRDLLDKIHFDEQLKGFHGYDFDISIQSTIAGYANQVIYDVDLEHFSRGKTDMAYFRNLIAIFKKWETHLPLIDKNIPKEQLKEIPKIENKNLTRLLKKMSRKGFDTTEILTTITYYGNLIDKPSSIPCLKFRIFFIRLFNCPTYIFK